MSELPHLPTESGWPAIGAVLGGRYRLVKRIGEGGMAAVYLAERVDDGIRVAIKVLRPELTIDPEVVRRFLQEARAASMIRHKNIVGILDFGFTDDGVAFLAMEHLEGDDLATVLEREGPMPWDRLAPLLLDACAALGAAHAQGIVHRDVKPENCFLLRGPDGQPQVKVLDFGIAKDIGGSLPDRVQTATGMLCGSPEYIAPEVIMGKVAEAGSDIYALGITMYELLTGAHPFAGAEMGEMLARHVQGKPPSFASRGVEAAPGVEALVMRCLAKHPDERPLSMEALAADIRAVSAGRALSPLPSAPEEPSAGRRGLVVGLVVGLVAIAALVAVVVALGSDDAGVAETDASETTTAAGGATAGSDASSGDASGDASGGDSSSTADDAETGDASTSAADEGPAAPEPAPVRDAKAKPLTAAAAKRIIGRKIAGKARACLREHTSLVRGQRFDVEVTISDEGEASAKAKLLPSSAAARCIGELFRKTRFPASKSGVSLSYSFTP
ncbi:MAG: protein kinase [Nannocystaceae bacterium]